jgi:translation initiation factor 5B
MPFLIYNHKDKDKVKEIFKKELTDTIKTEKKGIIAKADSLGSLEALLVLLKQSNIPVLKAGIGNINKTDFVNAKVVYRLIERLEETRENLRKEIEKQKLMALTTLCKLEVLHQYVFRITKPAIFGIKVLGGKLNPNVNLIDETQQDIGRVKNIQSEKNSVPEADEGMEVAISIPGVNYEKQLQDKKFLYSNISERQFKEFKKNKDLLSQNEIKILQEIAELKRKNQPEWGI